MGARMSANANLRLVAKRGGHVIYPHDVVIVDQQGEHYVMDSWEESGSIYVVPSCLNRTKERGRTRRHISEFDLLIKARP
jgi:hypothetical protein